MSDPTIEQLRARAEAAERAAGEMRSVLEASKHQNLGHRCSDGWFISRDKALSTTCGQGYRSAEEVAALTKERDEFRRRFENQKSFLEKFAKCLDGLPINWAAIPGSGIDGARDADSIRRVADSLQAKVEQLRRALEFYADKPAWHLCEATTDIGRNIQEGDPFMGFEKGEDHPWSIAQHALSDPAPAPPMVPASELEPAITLLKTIRESTAADWYNVLWKCDKEAERLEQLTKGPIQ